MGRQSRLRRCKRQLRNSPPTVCALGHAMTPVELFNIDGAPRQKCVVAGCETMIPLQGSVVDCSSGLRDLAEAVNELSRLGVCMRHAMEGKYE